MLDSIALRRVLTKLPFEGVEQQHEQKQSQRSLQRTREAQSDDRIQEGRSLLVRVCSCRSPSPSIYKGEKSSRSTADRSEVKTALAMGDVGIIERKKVPSMKEAMSDFLAWLHQEHASKSATYGAMSPAAKRCFNTSRMLRSSDAGSDARSLQDSDGSPLCTPHAGTPDQSDGEIRAVRGGTADRSRSASAGNVRDDDPVAECDESPQFPPQRRGKLIGTVTYLIENFGGAGRDRTDA